MSVSASMDMTVTVTSVFMQSCARTGELHDLRCAGGGITRLRLSYDDSVLFAAAADGCFLVFDVRDRDPTRLGKGCGTQGSLRLNHVSGCALR